MESVKDGNIIKNTADVLFEYLRDEIYNPNNAFLDPEKLPEEFHNFANGLIYYCQLVNETKNLSKEIASGNLDSQLPSPENEIAAPLKMLQAALKHLTWQAQQVAKGDYKQRVDFMGTFSESFNDMIKQLERRRSESANEKSRLQRNVDLLLTNYPELIMMFDLQRQLAFASDSCVDFFGADSIDEILNKPCEDLFYRYESADFFPVFINLFVTALEGKHTINTECDIDINNDGDPRHFQVKITPVFDASGRAEGVMYLLHDSTEIVKARDLAEKSLRVRSDFLARMSHEMRTPMNAIIGMASIHNTADEVSQKDYCIDQIMKASRHMMSIINDLLEIAGLVDENYTIVNSSFDFTGMIEKITGDIEFPLERRKQQFNKFIDESIPRFVCSDEQRLIQILSHLISNAMKFSPDKNEIDLSVKKFGDDANDFTLRFTVTDNGIGISEEHQKILFIPFEQIDGGLSRKYGGAGLGLAICKRVVTKMGGDIKVESEPGKGSSFIFEVPASIGEDPSHEEVMDDGIFAGKKILLAEDVEMNREIVCALIEFTGVAIDCAKDGHEALEMFIANPGVYDLIFMDIHMPHLDGYETTKKIRASGVNGAAATPIIAMTANVFREDIERCIATGMNGHVGKPIDAEAVIAVMKKHLL